VKESAQNAIDGGSSQYASILKRFPKVAEAWLAKDLKTVSAEEVKEVTGLSRQRVASAIKHRLTKGPGKSQKYTVASVLKWLETIPDSAVNDGDAPAEASRANERENGSSDDHPFTRVLYDLSQEGERQVAEVAS